MIRRWFCYIAGIDADTLLRCPATDKLWATHLGFSLLLSFLVVLGIAFHATGYVIENVWIRLIAATVVALTIFMFDRALYQSDWFYQGIFKQDRGSTANISKIETLAKSIRRILRITIRLAISFVLAWIIAVFLELAIFSDTIADKIKSEHLVANAPIYEKIEKYEAQLAAEIEERRRNLFALEANSRNEFTLSNRSDPPAPLPADGHLRDIRASNDEIETLDKEIQRLRTELRQIEDKIISYAEEMNAEALGRRLHSKNSGRAGAGPKYEFAKRQREIYDSQRAARESEILQFQARREDLRVGQTRMAGEARVVREQDLASAQARRKDLYSQIDLARRELRDLEASRVVKVDTYRAKALSTSEYRKLKDDPLSRMRAYQELKNDPKEGATVILFSWMTTFLVIFLEVVPVLAKMFFSPPSVYATKIQTEVKKRSDHAVLEVEQENIHSGLREVQSSREVVGRSTAATTRPMRQALTNFKLGELDQSEREWSQPT